MHRHAEIREFSKCHDVCVQPASGLKLVRKQVMRVRVTGEVSLSLCAMCPLWKNGGGMVDYVSTCQAPHHCTWKVVLVRQVRSQPLLNMLILPTLVC